MLPKKLSGVRYKSATERNCKIQFALATGAEADGTPKAPVILHTTKAKIAFWRAKENSTGEQRNGEADFKITVNYNKNFMPTSGMVILYHDQTYNIESVSDVDGQRRQLEIWAWMLNDGV